MIGWLKRKILHYKCKCAARHLYDIIIACFERNVEKAIQAEAMYGRVFNAKHFKHESAKPYHQGLHLLFNAPQHFVFNDFESTFANQVAPLFQSHFQYILELNKNPSRSDLQMVGKKMFDVWASTLDPAATYEQHASINKDCVTTVFGKHDGFYFTYYAHFVASAILLAQDAYRTNTLDYFKHEIIHLLTLRMIALVKGIQKNKGAHPC